MSLFDKYLLSTTAKFKKLGPINKRRVATLIWISGYAPHGVRNSFGDVIESAAMGNDSIQKTIPQKTKNKIVLELTLALITSSQIPEDGPITYWWGLSNELLRGLVGALILSKNKDKRVVLEDTGYSTNTDDSRAQVLLKIAQLLGIGDDLLICLLKNAEFLKSWNDFVECFFSGNLFGMSREDEQRVFDNVPKHLRELSVRGDAIISDFIERANANEFESNIGYSDKD